MRYARILPVPLAIFAVLVPSAPAVAADGGGGTPVPAAGSPSPSPAAGRGGGASPGSLRQRRLARRRSAPVLTRAGSTARLSFYHHVFPLAGRFDPGGGDARFGAPRRGHAHQGQDLTAGRGTPVVAPRGGVVEAVGYQARGAGHYVVVDGDAEDRDYVFMHLRRGAVAVEEGDRVRTGQRVGEVGSTGRSSGTHLHFEVWTGGWHEAGGRPVDPLPLLRAWDGFS